MPSVALPDHRFTRWLGIGVGSVLTLPILAIGGILLARAWMRMSGLDRSILCAAVAAEVGVIVLMTKTRSQPYWWRSLLVGVPAAVSVYAFTHDVGAVVGGILCPASFAWFGRARHTRS